MNLSQARPLVYVMVADAALLPLHSIPQNPVKTTVLLVLPTTAPMNLYSV